MFRFAPLVFLFLGAAALAQITPPTSPTATMRAPGASVPVRLQFPNDDIKRILEFYERLTKKRLVPDAQVTGQLYIFVAGDVTPDEAIRIIETTLLLNGFTLVPVEGTDIVKVIGAGKNPRAASIPIISEELAIPDGERVITFLAKLRYADPVELQQTLTPFLGTAANPYTNITALPKSQAILLTDNSATIRGLLRIIREIDLPPAEVVSEFLALERADAKDVLEKLTAIFERQPSAGGIPINVPRSQPARVLPDGNPVPPGATAEMTSPNSVEIRGGTLSEDSIIIGKIKLTADIRTNRIHVVTRPVNLQFVRKLIREFDSSSPFGEPVSRPLRYVSAGDVFDVVVQAITEPGTQAGSQQQNAGTAPRPAGQTAANNRGGGGGTGGGSAFGNDRNGSGSTFDATGSADLENTPVETTPLAAVIGTTKIIADRNANAIVVIGNQDVKKKVFSLLDKLDQRIPQVMLHTVIGELSLTQREQFGVDYILRNSGLGLLNPIASTTTTGGGNVATPGDGTGTGSAATGGTTTTTTSTVAPTASNLATFNGNVPALNLNNLLNQNSVRSIAAGGASGLTGFITAGNSLTAIVTALENTNRFRVVSRPSVFTKNNKRARIASGQQIAVPTSTISSLNSVNNNGIGTQSQIQFKTVALELDIVPLINSDREVALDIVQKVDEVSGSTRIDNNDIPTIATRYVKTNVSVPNEGTLVLGGLIRSSESKSKGGIPLLNRIPIIGPLFGTRSKDISRTELVILIRPVVSWTPPEAIQIRERAQEFLNIEPDLESTLYPPGTRKKASAEVGMTKQSTRTVRSKTQTQVK